MSNKSPLGRTTAQPVDYAPEVLHAIARAENRAQLGIGESLPFHGTDIWNAWELTWLAANGQPQTATAAIRVPADSPNMVESKSLKLYLNSFAMTRQDSARAVAAVIARDLSACIGASVDVRLRDPAHLQAGVSTGRMPGVCLDGVDVDCSVWQVDAGLLRADPGHIVSEEFYTDALRSLCPVTGQPDIGSVAICYRGPRIDPAALLRYVVSYRQHSDFHEGCIERMFIDLEERCRPERLTVHGRYLRRGGIDINPFRSNFEDPPGSLRLWRQ